jgi:hypothetical protein
MICELKLRIFSQLKHEYLRFTYAHYFHLKKFLTSSLKCGKNLLESTAVTIYPVRKSTGDVLLQINTYRHCKLEVCKYRLLYCDLMPFFRKLYVSMWPLWPSLLLGHAIAQAVSLQFLTTAFWVWSQVKSYAGQSDTGAGLVSSCQFSFHQLLHIHYPSYHLTLYGLNIYSVTE